MLPEFFQFHNPTKIVYGAGIVSDLSSECEALAAGKYLLISDGSLYDIGLVDRVHAELESSGILVTHTFLDVPQDSDVQTVAAAAEAARQSGAEGLIALGGGSVIDTAKAANILFSESGDLVDDHSGAGTLTRPLKPLIAIPTTAGTGSECTRIAVIYDSESKTKLSFSDQYLLPSLAVLDPEITRSLPAGLTASTGMDALSHAVEAMVDIDQSPVTDALALGAISLIFRNITTAVSDGGNIDARGSMLIAANLAGITFSHSMVGCVHSLSHTIGGLYRVPHGVANAILLPVGMEYNFEEGMEKFALMLPAMGGDGHGLSTEEKARAAIDAVRALTRRLNELGALPLRLRDVGVPEDGLKDIAAAALDEGSSIYNPRELIPDELFEYLKKVY